MKYTMEKYVRVERLLAHESNVHVLNTVFFYYILINLPLYVLETVISNIIIKQTPLSTVIAMILVV